MPHHVVSKGNNRRRLFSYPRERRGLLRLIARGLDKSGCTLHAGSLLDNHVHLLPTPPSREALPAFVKAYAKRYAEVRNRARGGSGKLFEQSYWSKVVNSDQQLAYTTMYIDANPVAAGLVEDALDYRWSTYGIHVGEPERSEFLVAWWTPSPWYLGLGRTWDQRAERYRELFAWYVSKKLAPDHIDELRRFEEGERPYRRRLRRPDGTRASEAIAGFGQTRSEPK